MQIYTACVGHWTVPGLHTHSFSSRPDAEAWVAKEFGEFLMPELAAEFADEDGVFQEVEDQAILDTIARVIAGPSTMADYEVVIDLTNDLLSWDGGAYILENEMDLPGYFGALQPFAAAAKVVPSALSDDTLLFAHFESFFASATEIRVGDLRRAASVLSAMQI